MSCLGCASASLICSFVLLLQIEYNPHRAGVIALGSCGGGVAISRFRPGSSSRVAAREGGGGGGGGGRDDSDDENMDVGDGGDAHALSYAYACALNISAYACAIKHACALNPCIPYPCHKFLKGLYSIFIQQMY